MKNTKIKIYLVLFLIILLGFFLRVFNIENVPTGIYPDEGVNGEDAFLAMKSGNWEWFYTANNGREGLFINIIAIFFKIFGVGILSLKLPSIIFGTLSVWGTYLLTKEIFKKEQLALLSAFLVSFSFWSINFSRISFRAIMLPAILVFSFYFLWKGLRTKKTWDFVWGGLIFGVGLHSYIAFRIAPLILFLTLVFLIWENKSFLKEYWRKIVVFVFCVLLSSFPMIYTFMSHPEYLESRSASISVLAPEVNQGHLLKTFFRSFGLSLAKYNFWGDQNWRHGYPPYPILNPVVGIFFLIGFGYFFFYFFKNFYRKIIPGKNSSSLVLSVFILSWFFLLLAPEFMTAEGLPHALRSIGTLPIVYILAAFGFYFILEKVKKYSVFSQKLVLSVFLCCFIFIAVFNSLKYHIFWANKKEVAISFEKNLLNVVDYIKETSSYKEKFIVTGSMQRVPIKLLTNNLEYVYYFYPNEIDKINPQNPTYFEIIMTEKNEDTINFLKEKFDLIKFTEEKDDMGISFFVLKK